MVDSDADAFPVADSNGPTDDPADVSAPGASAGDTAGNDQGGSGDEPTKRQMSLRSRVGLGLVGLVVAWFGYNFIDVWVGSTNDYEGSATAAVVLGAAQYNGSPSAALAGRLDAAAELYLSGRVEMVVVTGGGQPADVTTEAKTGYDYLRLTAGIPDEDLRLEVDGTSTYESLAAVSRFLADEGIDEVIVVTDPYHARRSQLIAREVGLDAEVVSTDAGVSFSRIGREAVATSLGRIVGFRRADAYLDVF